MRSTVDRVFFLAMVLLGFMPTGLQASAYRTSNVRGTAEGGAQHRLLLKGKAGTRAAPNRTPDDETNGDPRRKDPPPFEQTSAVPAATEPGTLADADALLGLHNEARCLHNADPLAYSDEVAASAMDHADVLSSSCGDLYHSESEDRNGYGENLFMCETTDTVSCYTPEAAMASLYESEVQVETVAEYGGDATQILWKSTTLMGCAVAACELDALHYVYLVCQYNPVGNVLANLEDEVELPTGTAC